LEGRDFTSLNEVFLNDLLGNIKSKINKEPKTLIDLGCGTGDVLLKFAKKGFDITGVDYSEVGLKKAEDRLKKSGINNFNLTNCDLDDLNIEGKFDIVLCKLTYAFVKDKDIFLERVKGLMKDDSVFILITPVLHDKIKYLPEDKPDIAVDFEETKHMLAKHLYEVKEFHHNYYQDKIDEVAFILMK